MIALEAKFPGATTKSLLQTLFAAHARIEFAEDGAWIDMDLARIEINQIANLLEWRGYRARRCEALRRNVLVGDGA